MRSLTTTTIAAVFAMLLVVSSASAARGGKKPPKDDDGSQGQDVIATATFRDCLATGIADGTDWDDTACSSGSDNLQSDGDGPYDGTVTAGSRKNGNQYRVGGLNPGRALQVSFQDCYLLAGCTPPFVSGDIQAPGGEAGFRVGVGTPGGMLGMDVGQTTIADFLSVFPHDGDNWFLEYNPEQTRQGCGGSTFVYITRLSNAAGSSVWEVTTDDPDTTGTVERGRACLYGGTSSKGRLQNAGTFEMDFAFRIEE